MPVQVILEYIEQLLYYQKAQDASFEKAEASQKKTSTLVAHRGYTAQATENSLSAFIHAAELGAKGLELDITTTQDGEIVVFHGPKIYNTTHCRGEQRSVCQMTLKELKSCKLNDGQEVLTLDEILPQIKNLFDIYFFDLKEQDPEVCEQKNNDLFNKALASVIKNNLKNKSVFSSYDASISNALGVITMVPTALDSFHLGDKKKLVASEYDYFMTPSGNITAEVVEEIHSQERKLVAYTVNTLEELQRLQSLGVDYIITDELELFLKP